MASRRVDNRKILNKYFDFSEPDVATCLICYHSLKSDRTFNLKNHVINLHQINEEIFKPSANDSASSVAEKQIRKHAVKIYLDKKRFVRSYIGLLVEDNIPFDVLRSENFQNLIDPICIGISNKMEKKLSVNSSKCEEVVKSVAKNIRNDIQIQLNERLLSLKIDSATHLSRNVFVISAQYIKNIFIRNHFLGVVEQKVAATGFCESLDKIILKTLNKYDIDLDQIISVVSDYGVSKININKIFEDVCDQQGLDEGNEMYFRHVQMFENTLQIHLGNIEVCRCAAHTAQLCALDLLKDPEIRKYILNCRNLVKFVTKPSSVYREIFDSKELSLPELDCPTKWGSTYNMIKSLQTAKALLTEIDTIKSESVEDYFESNISVWNFIEAYCIAFEPLQRTILKFHQKQLHYGDFYAEWLKCKLCTEKILEKGEKLVKHISRTLLSSIEHRTQDLLHNDTLIACLYLDPRFNHTLTPAQKIEASNFLKNLYERIKSLNIYYEDMHPERPSSPEIEILKCSENGDEYLNEYLERNFKPAKREKLDACEKIESLKLPFCRADTDVLQFWKKKQYSDPELYTLSNLCFAVPTTQVTNESAFLSFKHILTDNRNRFDQDTLDNILLVKLNSSYLDQACKSVPLFEEEKDI